MDPVAPPVGVAAAVPVNVARGLVPVAAVPVVAAAGVVDVGGGDDHHRAVVHGAGAVDGGRSVVMAARDDRRQSDRGGQGGFSHGVVLQWAVFNQLYMTP